MAIDRAHGEKEHVIPRKACAAVVVNVQLRMPGFREAFVGLMSVPRGSTLCRLVRHILCPRESIPHLKVSRQGW